MQIIRKFGEILLYAGIGFLAFLLAFEYRLDIPTWLAVGGRMHPMFLHFPIVLLLLSFVIFWIPLKEDYNWSVMLRLVAALSAVVTAIMGMLLSLEGGMSGDVLDWHKWTGAGIAAMGFLFYTSYSFLKSKKATGKVFSIVAVSGIMLTGHFGAELTHGENFLLEPFASNTKAAIDPKNALVFQDVIKPIFDRKCADCHSSSNMKGELVLNDTAGIAAGGKTGELFKAGEPDMSLLIQRIHLPMSDKKRMPPRSAPQLTYDEVVLLRAWIKSGAPINSQLAALPEEDTFRVLATRYLGPPPAGNSETFTFKAADDETIRSLNTNYRIVESLGMGSPALTVSFFGKQAYSKKSLEELLVVKQQIIELSLARMPVKDDDLSVIKQFPNLRQLNLNLTDITSKGLEQLKDMKQLRQISVSGTSVDAKGLEHVLSIPSLSSVFIWDTGIDSTELKAVRNKYKDVTIESGYYDDGSTITAVSPPIIQTTPGIFQNQVTIQVRHPFKGTTIRYTLDGSKPDSVHGEIYQEPIVLDSTATFTARAYKEGWYGSDVSKALFLKRTQVPDSIEVVVAPDPPFRGSGKLMLDEELGDLNYGDGQWLGFLKNDATIYLYFNEETPIQQVLLNMLKRTREHVFPPVRVEVWGGMNKNDLKLLGKIEPPRPKEHGENTLIQEKVAFQPTPVKVLKVIARGQKKLPEWHERKGQDAWLFMNEVVLE